LSRDFEKVLDKNESRGYNCACKEPKEVITIKLDTLQIEILLAERKMTQTDLARESGISRQNISTILSRGSCSPKTAGRLAQGFGVPLTELVTSCSKDAKALDEMTLEKGERR